VGFDQVLAEATVDLIGTLAVAPDVARWSGTALPDRYERHASVVSSPARCA